MPLFATPGIGAGAGFCLCGCPPMLMMPLAILAAAAALITRSLAPIRIAAMFLGFAAVVILAAFVIAEPPYGPDDDVTEITPDLVWFLFGWWAFSVAVVGIAAVWVVRHPRPPQTSPPPPVPPPEKRPHQRGGNPWFPWVDS